jgi:hypothetical protein
MPRKGHYGQPEWYPAEAAEATEATGEKNLQSPNTSLLRKVLP